MAKKPASEIRSGLRRAAGALTGAMLALYCTTSGADVPAGLDPSGLELASVHAAVATLDSGELLYTKDARRAVPVASLTKLMTAMVVLDSGAPLDQWLSIIEREKQPPIKAVSRLRIGSQLQRRNLLKIMLMSSENLAAYVLAYNYDGGYAAFIQAMNAKARALGMPDSYWVNPSGLSRQNRATAAGLVKMVRAAYEYPVIRKATQTGSYIARFRQPVYSLAYGNTNPFVHSAKWQIRLTKTGYLDVAGQCLALVVTVDKRDIIMVFLDSFGRRSPHGDMGRVARWLTTGDGGAVAGAARDYAQRKTRHFAQADRIANTYIALAAAGREHGEAPETWQDFIDYSLPTYLRQ